MEDRGYEYTPLYYHGPTQVKFYYHKKYFGGIAYQDFIICGSNGDIMNIDEIINEAAADGVHFDDAIVELSWANIDRKIFLG